MPKNRPADPAKNTAKASSSAPAGCAAPAHAASELCSGKGMADPDLIGEFVPDFKNDVAKNWDKLTPDERFAAVKNLQEKQFEKAGLPVPTISRSKDAAAGFDNPVTMFGQASSSTYGMTYNGNLFEKSPLTEHDQKELAKTMMHEGRHNEQYFKVAQYRAAEGMSVDDMATTETATHKKLDLPKDIREKAANAPLPKKKSGTADDCPNYTTAKEWNDAKYGKGALSQYRPEVDYADRPLEKDAWGLEPTVDAKW